MREGLELPFSKPTTDTCKQELGSSLYCPAWVGFLDLDHRYIDGGDDNNATMDNNDSNGNDDDDDDECLDAAGEAGRPCRAFKERERGDCWR